MTNQEIDNKVGVYLKRARNSFPYRTYDELIEIAKIIQLEEQHQEMMADFEKRFNCSYNPGCP